MVQLVKSLHASSLYSTRVLPARTTFTADDTTCAISARLEPLLDPRGFGAHYLCHRCCSLCTLRTPRAFTRTVCSWRALLVPLMMQLVQSLNTSGLYSTRVPLAGTVCPADTTACAISKHLEPLFDPRSPCRHELSHRCYSLCSPRTPRAFTRPGFPGKHELSHRCYSLCSLRTPRVFTRSGFP